MDKMNKKNNNPSKRIRDLLKSLNEYDDESSPLNVLTEAGFTAHGMKEYAHMRAEQFIKDHLDE
jgi:hypothetical protein